MKNFFKDIFESGSTSNSTQKIKNLKVLVIFLLFVINLILVVFLFTRLVNPDLRPRNVLISNLNSDQATLSWVTSEEIDSLVVLSESKNFPLFPYLASRKFHDDKDKDFDKPKRYKIHHVKVFNLRPETTFYLGIYVGPKIVRQIKFETPSVTKVQGPVNKIEGRVFESDGKSRLGGANVYFRAKSSTSSSQLLSTTTDGKGKWKLDISNLLNYDSYQVTIEAGDLGRGEISTTSANLLEWPDIILRGSGI